MDLTAAGTFTLTGTAVLTVGDPSIPTLPTLDTGGAATPPPLPEPITPPPGLPFEGIYRTSEILDAPTLDESGLPVDWTETQIDEPWATVQIVVEGVDITEIDDVLTPFPSWGRGEPFGPATCTIRLPQVSTFEPLPAWCVKGASVDVVAHLVAGGSLSLWAGVVDKLSHDEPTGDLQLVCRGPLLVSDLQLRKPGWDSTPKDVGLVIADVLNGAVSKRCDPIAPVVTGCQTSVLGGWEPLVVGHVQQLLATAITDGRQWTVKCDQRAPVLALKDTTTVDLHVSNGQRGIDVQLDQDWSQAPNVIYGEGISPTGGRWRNAVYPGWRPDSAPAWPMSPTQSFHVGSTDAATTSGTGVSDWQRRVGQPVTGYYSAADRARCIAVQQAAGITVDGFVGPQTWAASFAIGSNTGTLDAFFMPLAFAPQVMPRLYGPDGTDLGANPVYDPSILRVEDKLDFGQGVTKDRGRQAAADMLPRVMNPGWVGTITLEVDPAEMSRYAIREGMNVRVDNFRGGEILLHVAYVDADEASVRLTVDTNARDYPTLDAIVDRERNAIDPAKSIVTRLTKASVTEARATFDDESPAGQLPRHALFAGLWTVIPVPFGAYGSIARTSLTTSGPASAFCTAVFDRQVTAAQIRSAMGGNSPFDFDLASPWDTFAEQFDALGLLMAWGWGSQPCGYYPLSYSTPATPTEAAPVTGRMVDDASWSYSSSRAPWLWVASLASAGCWLSGRFYPGVDS